jgi:uncharacterized membrane protein
VWALICHQASQVTGCKSSLMPGFGIQDAALCLLQGGYLLQAAAGSALGRQVRASARGFVTCYVNHTQKMISGTTSIYQQCCTTTAECFPSTVLVATESCIWRARTVSADTHGCWLLQLIQYAKHKGIKTINLVRRQEQVQQLKDLG